MATSRINLSNAVTLIELLIAISITTILTSVLVFMLRTSFDAFSFAQEEILLEKILDTCLEEIASGSFENYGIKDAFEILKVSPNSITFVPLWVDDSHSALAVAMDKMTTLNRQVKPGSVLPIAEVSTDYETRTKQQIWKTVPITFIPGLHKDPNKLDDRVFLNVPLDVNSKIRFVFQPDATNFPDCAITIRWQGDRIIRTYKDRTETIPRYNISGVKLSDFRLEYFDNTNTEIEPRSELIHNITAVKLSLEAMTETKTKYKSTFKKQAFVFINVRNSRTAGRGLLIQKGTRIKIPDSKHIRIFSLSNVSGIKERGIIELETRPKQGTIWKIRIILGFDDEIPILKRYSVEYPPGRPVYSETINLTTDLPLNFLNLGGGRYDYDFDKNASNLVNLEGEVELVVTKMDALGAVLFIRP